MVSDEHVVYTCSCMLEASFLTFFLIFLRQITHLQSRNTIHSVLCKNLSSHLKLKMARAALFSLRQKSIQNPSVATVIDLESYKVEESSNLQEKRWVSSLDHIINPRRECAARVISVAVIKL